MLLQVVALGLLKNDAPFFLDTTPHLGPGLPQAVQSRFCTEILETTETDLPVFFHFGRTGTLGFDLDFYVVLPAFDASTPGSRPEIRNLDFLDNPGKL